MRTDDEKKLLKLMKIGPLGILIFSIFLIFLITNDNINNLNNELLLLEKNLVESQKKISKQEVLRVHKYITFQKKHAEAQLKESLKIRVYEAHTIMSNLYSRYKDTKTKEEILDLIKTSLRDIRFNKGRGYYYILTMKGINVLQPIKPSLEGTNLYNLKDKKGVYLNQNIIRNMKENTEGYDAWHWYKPGDLLNEHKKYAFSKYFAPYDIYVGTGEYLTDFENELQKRILDYVSTITYGKNGYVFILSYEGYNLAHIKPSFRGVYFNDLQDPNGVYSVRELNKIAKKGEGYLEYVGEIMPTTGKRGKKISFAKGFSDWEWTIGSGVYLQDINELIIKKKTTFKAHSNKQIVKVLILTLVAVGIFLILAFIFSKRIEKMFKTYSKKIELEIKDNSKKEKLIFEQAKMVSLAEMLENISHQWRQPLSVITTSSTGMRLKKENNILEDVDFYNCVDNITTQANFLSKTIEDFRNFLKSDNENILTNVQEVINRALSILEPKINENNILVVKNIKSNNILTLEKDLLQALMKIISNAYEVLLSIKENRVLFLESYVDQNKLIIKIKDNGGGVPKEIISRVFEPYFTTKHKSQGKGIGLYMVHEIIYNNLHGEVFVKNEKYKFKEEYYHGAEFTITLPHKV